MNNRLDYLVILICFVSCALPWRTTLAENHLWEIPRFTDSARGLNDALTGTVIDAPDGYTVLALPELRASVVRTDNRPAFFDAVRYVEQGGLRLYLPKEAFDDKTWERKQVGWVFVHGNGRAEFNQTTIPARLLKKEQRNDLKLGPVNAEVYQETVPIAETTEWGASFRRAEIDFAMPVKVISFQELGESHWEVSFTVFPAFNSDVARIPGPKPEFYDDPYRALITMPGRREAKITGQGRIDEYRNLLQPGTVWAAGVSEGRLQALSIGYSRLPPEVECSPLSNPAFHRGDRLSFRFLSTKLDGSSVMLETTPDRIFGVDYTDYSNLARLRPMEDPGPEYVHPDEWNIVLNSRMDIVVIAPLMEGRGGAGMVELESLDLGDAYEQDLKTLRAFWKIPPPEFSNADAGWSLFLDVPMGEIPFSQRGE